MKEIIGYLIIIIFTLTVSNLLTGGFRKWLKK
jgi:hypothetical protein